MRRSIALGVASLVLAACEPMYGQRSESLHNPKPTAAVPTSDVIAGPAYVEDCTVDFQRKPPRTGVKRDGKAAATLVTTGDKTIHTADATVDTAKRVDLVRESIDRYATALARDPYSADATLKLALAYDRVYRKGCALALLRRLVALAGNPAYASDATADIDQVDDNKHWFRDYRKEALKAIGH
jgi:hypothetical protein